MLFVVAFEGIFLDVFHVILDVDTEDSFSVDLGVVGFLVTFLGETGVSLVGVGDVETTIASTLQATENSVTGGGGDQSDIEDSLEWLSLTFLNIVDDVVVLTIDLLVTSIKLVKTSLVEESSGQKQSSSIAGSVVGKTAFETILSEFGGLSFAEDSVTLDSGISDLADNSLVGDSGNESVLGGVVFILVLDDQSSSGIVVSLSL